MGFDPCYARRIQATIEGISVPVISREDLLANKCATHVVSVRLGYFQRGEGILHYWIAIQAADLIQSREEEGKQLPNAAGHLDIPARTATVLTNRQRDS